MTEEEWKVCDDPARMPEFVRGKVSDRKLRLFAVTCCRRLAGGVANPKVLYALDLAGRAADGADVPGKLRRAGADLRDAMALQEQRFGEFGYIHDTEWFPTRAVARLFGEKGIAPVSQVVWIPGRVTRAVRETTLSAYRERDALAEQAAMADLVREVCGDPFRPVALDPSWLTSAVTALSNRVYDTRDFSLMPILHDALIEAGCDDADVLGHCRDSNAVHVRGCWVVDMLTDRR